MYLLNTLTLTLTLTNSAISADLWRSVVICGV